MHRVKTHCRLKRRRKPHQWRKCAKTKVVPKREALVRPTKGQALQVPGTPRNLRSERPNPESSHR